MLRKIITFLFDSVYQVITWVWIAASISSFFFFAGKPSGQRGQGMAWSAVSLFLAVAAMIILVAKRYFFDAEDDPKNKARAELFIEGARMLPLEPGKSQKILLSVRNRGKLAARNINVGGANNRFLPKTFTGPLEYEYVDSDTRPDLAADAEAVMAVDAPMGITKETIQLLNDGELLFFHYGKGEYEEGFGGPYPIDFCFMYTPLTPTIMRTCPLRYWPKGGGQPPVVKPRPELSIEKVFVKTLEPGKPETILMIVKNRGKSTAHNITLYSTRIHERSTFQGPLIYANNPPDVTASVATDADLTIEFRSTWINTVTDVKAIKSAKFCSSILVKVSTKTRTERSIPLSIVLCTNRRCRN